MHLETVIFKRKDSDLRGNSFLFIESELKTNFLKHCQAAYLFFYYLLLKDYFNILAYQNTKRDAKKAFVHYNKI